MMIPVTLFVKRIVYFMNEVYWLHHHLIVWPGECNKQNQKNGVKWVFKLKYEGMKLDVETTFPPIKGMKHWIDKGS